MKLKLNHNDLELKFAATRSHKVILQFIAKLYENSDFKVFKQ